MPLPSGLLSIGHDDTACATFPLVRVAVRGTVEPPTFRFSGQRVRALRRPAFPQVTAER
jgi:hypothetical protein